ncbi:hypothetical protein COPEUT_00959 [Coprococcus eutactus ATCC 27759]|nr:hypothetical protein COPEUT_00959 [Coprococcus eutactus ATCC 27759]
MKDRTDIAAVCNNNRKEVKICQNRVGNQEICCIRYRQ